MSVFSSGLSIGELTALLGVIILSLIPLMIWMLWEFDSRIRSSWSSAARRVCLDRNCKTGDAVVVPTRMVATTEIKDAI